MESNQNSQDGNRALRRSTRRRENPASEGCSTNATNQPNTNVVSLTDQEKRDLTCAVCLKKYSRLDTLVAHHRNVHNDTVIECDVCLKRFSSTQGLERHQVTHNDARPHRCPRCLKSFKRADSLAAHEDTHWEFVNEKECEYEYCHLKFDNYQSYQRHRRSRTDVPYVPPDASEFIETDGGKYGKHWKGKNCAPTPLHPAYSVQFLNTNEEKDHQCVKCFKVFKGCRPFYDHLVEYHYIRVKGSCYSAFNPRHRRLGVNCDICLKLFGTKQEIKKHKTIAHSV